MPVLDAREAGPSRAAPRPRALFLVDALDLTDGQSDPARVFAAIRGCLVVAGYSPGDVTVVGVPTWLARRFAWSMPPGVALRCWHESRGGRTALLRYAGDPDQIARSFDRVVVGSGDDAFASLAEQLVGVGVAVTVVARRGAVSTRLRRAGDEWVLLGSLIPRGERRVGRPASTPEMASCPPA